MDKEDLFEKRMRELGKKAYYRGILTFSDFLDLNQQNILHSLSFRDTGVKVETFGGYESAERQMAAFVPEALSYEQDYPIACVKIQPLNRKFSEDLTHRDYLGAILNLGIDRAKIGDILLDQEAGYVFCQESMAASCGRTDAYPSYFYPGPAASGRRTSSHTQKRGSFRYSGFSQTGQCHRPSLWKFQEQYPGPDRGRQSFCKWKEHSF